MNFLKWFSLLVTQILLLAMIIHGSIEIGLLLFSVLFALIYLRLDGYFGED